ncbi:MULTISPECIES: DNA-binding protein [Nocardia]|uniref:DNA-binding protein n=1 Tax=Nocardia TaxID=1817 RepID=UPI001895DBCC|nr:MULTISPECIES: DNA-binding protein [Nocardia]MBF6351008.1 DNA-binding protein [Nocardia flavorosea]
MERQYPRTTPASRDHSNAQREHEATGHLLALGASDLAARPWRPAPAPPSAIDLLHYTLWRSGELAPDAIADALTLLPAARAELDGLEAGMLFTARGAGLTWAQIADAMGFNSPQACQQYYNRLTSRHGSAS